MLVLCLGCYPDAQGLVIGIERWSERKTKCLGHPLGNLGYRSQFRDRCPQLVGCRVGKEVFPLHGRSDPLDEPVEFFVNGNEWRATLSLALAKSASLP